MPPWDSSPRWSGANEQPDPAARGLAAVGIDDEENIVASLTNRLDPDFAVVSTGILLFQCEFKKDARGVIETKTSLPQSAPALGLVPLKEHARGIYALSVSRSISK